MIWNLLVKPRRSNNPQNQAWQEVCITPKFDRCFFIYLLLENEFYVPVVHYSSNFPHRLSICIWSSNVRTEAPIFSAITTVFFLRGVYWCCPPKKSGFGDKIVFIQKYGFVPILYCHIPTDLALCKLELSHEHFKEKTLATLPTS